MTISDLLFLLTVLATLLGLVRGLYQVARRRGRAARRTFLVLGTGLGLYAAALVAASLASPQRVLALHQDRCFDDWCLAVEEVARRRSLGSVTARGQIILVTVLVSSTAQRISQRALDAQVYLLDGGGRRYDPLPVAQRVLDATGAGGQPLDSELAPGGSFTRTVAFDVPSAARGVGLVVAHGLFPGLLIVGDAQSVLHRPTVIALW